MRARLALALGVANALPLSTQGAAQNRTLRTYRGTHRFDATG